MNISWSARPHDVETATRIIFADHNLDEFEFRYNNRKNPYLFRDTLTKLVMTEAMPYEQLTQSA